MSFTVCWLNILVTAKSAGWGTPLEWLCCPVSPASWWWWQCSPLYPLYSITSSNDPLKQPLHLKHPRANAMIQEKCFYAVLQLICLGDRRHTGVEIQAALQGQAERWLTQCHLVPGKVVCNNNNLLAALRQGKFTCTLPNPCPKTDDAAVLC